MAQPDTTPTKSTRRNSVGRHRARSFFDDVFRVHQRACRRGHHRFGNSTPIGGGIQRSACSECGSVSIDIGDATDPVRPPLAFRRAGVRQRV